MCGKPRYSFGDVNGVMKNGLDVSIGIDQSDKVNISFNYRDDRDGIYYYVQTSGYRTKKEPAIAPKV